MTLHIYDELEQGTEEWHTARRGILTASVVGKLITAGPPAAISVDCPTCGTVANTPCINAARKLRTEIKSFHEARTAVASEQPPVYSVADNDTSRALTLTLAAERITGWTEDTPMTSDMWRGVEAEPFAREAYAKHIAPVPVEQVGFMIRTELMPWDPNELVRPVDDEAPTWELGYSPDGLVGDDGLLEIKAPRAKTHVQTVLADAVPAYNMAQLQGGLLVTGRKWIDFVPYVGGMHLYPIRVEPDPAWFDAITKAAIAFEKNVAQIVSDYEQAVAGLPTTERIDFNLVELKLA